MAWEGEQAKQEERKEMTTPSSTQVAGLIKWLNAKSDANMNDGRYIEAATALELLMKERDELADWKAQQMAVESEWDAQAIAKQLGATLGQSCRRVIGEKVPMIIAERDALLTQKDQLEKTVLGLKASLEAILFVRQDVVSTLIAGQIPGWQKIDQAFEDAKLLAEQGK